jgi:indolepyruvate ferredoxin oxidoreductase
MIRMLIDVLRSDQIAGRRTAGFVSGYQGSPLAGFDRELQRALRESIGVEIVHQPAVNEELGATAVMGSQLTGTLGTARLDGVLGVWYAKSPGLDRSVDALRHANYAGASRFGGALALVGDDPMAKSSTLPSASEAVLADVAMPVLFPRSLSQLLEFGRAATVLSRWSGSWVAVKLVTSVADGEGTVALSEPNELILPEGYTAEGVTGDLLTPSTLAREPTVFTKRLEAAARFGDVNSLNRIVVDPPRAIVTLVAAGTVFSELIEAMRLLGLDFGALCAMGIRLAEVSMPYPIGAEFARRVATGVEEVVVIEERRELVESQLLSLLTRKAGHPAVVGRLDSQGQPFIPRHGSLDAPAIARILAPLLRVRFGDRVKPPSTPSQSISLSTAPSRVPWFCSGCPHSASTVVPDGTLVSLGIGCHSILNFMPEERIGHSIGITQMGGEGVQWTGMAPFVSDHHIVANMGDGTFFHSGQLALRASVSAGVSMTYKILWNGVSAMTGGQVVAGSVASPVDLATLLLIEGAKEVVITTDDISRYRKSSLPKGASVRPRDELIAVQQHLAGVSGVTVLIHDQVCANELRRARKRGLVSKPKYRVVINERVCEGCGDCQLKSNCLSLQTVDTPFGSKTRIDAETCNVDLSCLQGDCPAFTLVRGDDEPLDPLSQHNAPADSELPPAPPPTLAPGRPTTIRIAGIGGTGVVTTAHLLAWAALIDGLEVWGVDQTGLSQKAGPVTSDLRIGPGASHHSNSLGEGEVDVLLVADLMTANQPSVLRGLTRSRTVIVGTTSTPLSGPMVLGQQDRQIPIGELQQSLAAAAQQGCTTFLDAIELTREAGLSSAVVNVVLLGVAVQQGLLPVSAHALSAAIEQNGVDIDANLAGFRADRAWAAGLIRLKDHATSVTDVDANQHLVADLGLPDLYQRSIGALAADLRSYQGTGLVRRFVALVAESANAERTAGGDGRFTAAVATGYHKLLAYKDEYEVARLLLEHPSAHGPTTWLLHPPVLRSRGLKRKIRLGPWARPVMKGLRAGRRLRGSVFDPFGRTPLRRTERQLPVDYARAIRLLHPLLAVNLEGAITIALLPDSVRGYEKVKERSVTTYQSELSDLLGAWMAQLNVSVATPTP